MATCVVQVVVMVLYVALVSVLSIILIPWLVPRLCLCFVAGMTGGHVFRNLVDRKKNAISRKAT